MAQQVEHVLGKDEVPGSNPGISSKRKAVLNEYRFSFRSLIKGSNAPKALFAVALATKGAQRPPSRYPCTQTAAFLVLFTALFAVGAYGRVIFRLPPK